MAEEFHPYSPDVGYQVPVYMPTQAVAPVVTPYTDAQFLARRDDINRRVPFGLAMNPVQTTMNAAILHADNRRQLAQSQAMLDVQRAATGAGHVGANIGAQLGARPPVTAQQLHTMTDNAVQQAQAAHMAQQVRSVANDAVQQAAQLSQAQQLAAPTAPAMTGTFAASGGHTPAYGPRVGGIVMDRPYPSRFTDGQNHGNGVLNAEAMNLVRHGYAVPAVSNLAGLFLDELNAKRNQAAVAASQHSAANAVNNVRSDPNIYAQAQQLSQQTGMPLQQALQVVIGGGLRAAGYEGAANTYALSDELPALQQFKDAQTTLAAATGAAAPTSRDGSGNPVNLIGANGWDPVTQSTTAAGIQLANVNPADLGTLTEIHGAQNPAAQFNRNQAAASATLAQQAKTIADQNTKAAQAANEQLAAAAKYYDSVRKEIEDRRKDARAAARDEMRYQTELLRQENYATRNEIERAKLGQQAAPTGPAAYR